VPYYPSEDEKLRATDISHRRGGNVPNTLEVLQQLVHQDKDHGHAPPLILCSVMPSASSVDSAKIKASFGPHVDLSRCLYREQCVEPASSYIIRSSSTDSRTIVNYNDLPEMTSAEFAAVADSFGSEAEATWYHFEV
jgi:ketohexokinase